MKLKFLKFLTFLLTITLISCKEQISYDLAIENIQIYDAVHLELHKNTTILIKNGKIAKIVKDVSDYKADVVIQGKNRLIAPGFIDTHIHLTDIIGDYDNAPEFIEKDSVQIYKSKIAQTHLKFGTTTIADMGQPEKWISEILNWQKNPTPYFPNLIITGSAIISDEERKPYVSHLEVTSPADAIAKVNEYHNLGLKQIKVYWRLREPEMKSVVEQAKALDMGIFAHIDNNVVSIEKALDFGIRNFEHASTISNDVFDFNQYGQHLNSIMQDYYPDINAYMVFALEKIQLIEDTPELRKKRDELLDKLIEQKATLSTTIHLFGSFSKRTYFDSFIEDYYTDENPVLNDSQSKRMNKAFDTYMHYIKSAYDKGLTLRIGTDCKNGGKAVLSEMMLLSEAGIPVKEVLKIATLNGAKALRIDKDYGSIEVGKTADLIIFDKSPIDDYKNFLSEKTVIKDGKIFEN